MDRRMHVWWVALWAVIAALTPTSLAQQPGGVSLATSQPQPAAASQPALDSRGQGPVASRPASTQATASDLDTQRAIGKAYYENAETPPQFEPAAAAFRRCMELAPDSAIDRFNLGLTLMRAEKYDEALAALTEAARLKPDLTAAAYVMGIVYKRLGKTDEAIGRLEVVTAQNPRCAGAYYNLAMCCKQSKQYQKAIAALKRAVELVPAHPAYHYQLLTLYRQVGDVENVKRHKEIFDQIKDTIDESEKTAEALERSEYSYIIEPRPLMPDLTPNLISKTRFTDATEQAGLNVAGKPTAPPAATLTFTKGEYDAAKAKAQYVASVGSGVVLGDFDGDGDLDIYVVNCAADPAASANRLYRNDGKGRFEDVTASAGVGDTGLGMAAVFGDYDNDGKEDSYVVNCGPNVLYHNEGNGTYKDVSEAAHAAEPQFGRAALFFDYDHDHDLDIFVANDVDLSNPPNRASFTLPDDFPGQVNALLRNNGNGTFSDLTDEAGLLVDCSQTRDALFADFDEDNDVDLFTVNANAPSLLFLNVRMGKFESGGAFSPPIEKHGWAAAEGDFNHDGHCDLTVAVDKDVRLYINDGHAKFTGTALDLPATLAGGVGRIRTLDYNNDGWTDLLLVGADGRSLGLLAGAGPGRFADRTGAAGLSGDWGQVADAAAGDLDGDGHEDIVLQTRDCGPRLLRNDSSVGPPWPTTNRGNAAQATTNAEGPPIPRRPQGGDATREEGGERGHWINVRLVGKKVNRDAYGATVEIAAGGHHQKQTVRGGGVHFGLGGLSGIDVIRVVWPNGQAQNVIQPAIDRTATIEQHVKVSASCAFLYAFNSRQFEMVNEILGVGPLGAPMGPGVYFPVDHTELTKIAADQLAPQDGFYELRLTEELREITYADEIKLRVVDHPAGLELIANEMFAWPPPEDKFYAVADVRTPVSAMDDRGHDVLPLISERDGRFPTFPLIEQYDGLAAPHSLALDLGDLRGAKQILLGLDGWIYWAEASVTMAVAQDPRYAITPLKLEVRDAAGAWRTAVESVGLPTSKGIVVPLDLTLLVRESLLAPQADDYHVRLSTTLCVYFDRILVATRDEAALCRVTELPVARADLHYRGFSRMTRDPLGYEKFDYYDMLSAGSWDPPAGMYTRYGDVAPLLAQADDEYVIFGPGDELSLGFDGRRLPAPPAGWVREFIFFADGWVKDGDLNTKYSETVGPLPFHGMSGYPYSTGEQYPQTKERLEYIGRYNTRPARPTSGELTKD